MLHVKSFVAACALVAVGCSPVADRCRSQTLLVAVTLDAASAAADSFSVTLSIDGAVSVQTTVAHTAGAASGNLVVDFPHGYPRGHTIDVAVDALVAGVVVGTGAAEKALAGDCETVALSIVGGDGDLGSDDGGGDDLATPDDLTPPAPDMVCVPSGAESGANCFDGIDNDCDGNIDCADSDCIAAQCVPTPSTGFTLGITTTPAPAFCPAMFISQVPQMNEGPFADSPDCSSGCTCTGVEMCSTQTTSYPMASCSGESDGNSADSTMCRGFNVTQPTKGISTDVLSQGGGSCKVGGSSTRSATHWTASDQFCKTAVMGGGCGAGMVCVPKLAVPICEVATGVVACDSGYNATAGTWYSDATINDARSCTCNCGSPTGGGSCAGTTVAFYTSTDCSGTAAATLGYSAQNCSFATTIHSVRINGASNPTCGTGTVSLSGGLSGTGPMTMCCRP